MIVKLFTNNVNTIDFLKENIKYYNIKGDVITQFKEDYNIKNECIIIYNINSIDYNPTSNILKLYYQNIAISIMLESINDMFIEKE